MKRPLDLKELIRGYLTDKGLEVVDFGTHGTEPVNYPNIAFAVAESVARGEFERAVLLCGTGIGMAIAANKVHGIRAAQCHDTIRPNARARATTRKSLQLALASLGLNWRRPLSTPGLVRVSTAGVRSRR
jgi:ribose 5-phosphate isomerase B